MKFLDKLRSFLGVQPAAPSSNTDLIYVYLPEDLGPTARGNRYEDAVDVELRLLGVGYVSGGGSSLGDEREDGTRPIEFCGLDVDVTDQDAGRALLRDLLPRLGCPSGTALWYREDDLPLQEEYDGERWKLARPRSDFHPAFGL